MTKLSLLDDPYFEIGGLSTSALEELAAWLTTCPTAKSSIAKLKERPKFLTLDTALIYYSASLTERSQMLSKLWGHISSTM